MNMSKFVAALGKNLRMNDSFADPVFRNLLQRYKSNDYLKYEHMQKPYSQRTVIKTDTYKLSLITWYINGMSNIHIHPEDGGWFKVLDGELEEIFYDKNFFPTKSFTLSKNSIRYVNSHMGYHRLQNASNKLAHSLHLSHDSFESLLGKKEDIDLHNKSL